MKLSPFLTTLLVLLSSAASADQHGVVGHAFTRNCREAGDCDADTSDIDLDLDDDIELIGPGGQNIICHRYQSGSGGNSFRRSGGKRKSW